MSSTFTVSFKAALAFSCVRLTLPFTNDWRESAITVDLLTDVVSTSESFLAARNKVQKTTYF